MEHTSSNFASVKLTSFEEKKGDTQHIFDTNVAIQPWVPLYVEELK